MQVFAATHENGAIANSLSHPRLQIKTPYPLDGSGADCSVMDKHLKWPIQRSLVAHRATDSQTHVGLTEKPLDQSLHLLSALRMLASQPWVGNAREPENVIERSLLLCEGESLTDEDLVFEEKQLDL